MTTVYIRDINTLLSLCNPETKIAFCFQEPHSWRGIYAEAAVEPAANRTVAELLTDISRLLSETFEAWKGGDYTYSGYSELHLSYEGQSTEHDWGAVLASIALAVAENQRATEDPV